MSEEIKKTPAFDLMSAFSQTAQTLEQAEAKAKQEKGRVRIDRFRTPDEGEYLVRVLPLAPVIDAEGNVTMPMDRQGCEFQLYNTFLSIDLPATKDGKVKQLRVPVIRANQKGVNMSIDLLDEYVRIAKSMYADDDAVLKLLTDSQSQHRIRYACKRLMYVLDITNGTPKGPMLWEVSNSNYIEIDDERRAGWTKENAKAAKKGRGPVGDPLCSISDAWPLTIIRKGVKFNDTKYTFRIDRSEDPMPLEEETLQALMDLPRIPDEIYHFTRYQLEAEVEFLKQYDAKHDLEVCKDDEFIEALEKLKGELSPDDQTHFSLSDKVDGKSGGSKNAITLESLYEAYDFISDEGLGKDSDEYEELKEDIRQFIVDNSLDVVVKHSKSVLDLLNEIKQAVEDKVDAPAPAKVSEAPKAAEPEADEEPEEEEEPKQEEAPVRRRRRAIE